MEITYDPDMEIDIPLGFVKPGFVVVPVAGNSVRILAQPAIVLGTVQRMPLYDKACDSLTVEEQDQTWVYLIAEDRVAAWPRDVMVQVYLAKVVVKAEE